MLYKSVVLFNPLFIFDISLTVLTTFETVIAKCRQPIFLSPSVTGDCEFISLTTQHSLSSSTLYFVYSGYVDPFMRLTSLYCLEPSWSPRLTFGRSEIIVADSSPMIPLILASYVEESELDWHYTGQRLHLGRLPAPHPGRCRSTGQSISF